MLTSQLGNPERKILTAAQLRRLASRARAMEKPEGDADLQEADLMAIGYGEKEARRIVSLLSEEDVLRWYLSRGAQKDCFPITRVSFDYPDRLRLTLGDDCPGCLWAKGDRTLLEKPAIALVGSRDLLPDNHAFAAEVGRQAARQGYVLVSGNEISLSGEKCENTEDFRNRLLEINRDNTVIIYDSFAVSSTYHAVEALLNELGFDYEEER